MGLEILGELSKTRKIGQWNVSETGIHSVSIMERFHMEAWDYEPNWKDVPEPPVSLALVKTRIDFNEDGYGDIVWSFQGMGMGGPSGISATQEVKQLRGNMTREPITSHPDIGQWIKDGYATGFTDGEVDWKTKDPTGKSKRKGFDKSGDKVTGINPLYGVRDYLAAGAEYTVTTARRGRLPSDLFTSVGRVFVAPPGMPVIDGRNWLMAGVSARQRGNSFEIRKHWLMSGIGGWIADLYKPAELK